MGEMKPEELLTAATLFADRARAQILELIKSPIQATLKSDHSFVTKIDVETERLLRTLIHKRFPAHGIIGEELGEEFPDSPYQWILDPIDGTAELTHGVPTYGTIIGLHQSHIPVVGVLDLPEMHLRCHAAKGQGCFLNGKRVHLKDRTMDGTERLAISSPSNFLGITDESPVFATVVKNHPNLRIFHSCLSHLLAASGGVDAMVEWNVKIWDLAASQIIVEEAGGKYVVMKDSKDSEGRRVLSAIFGKPSVVDAVVNELRGT